MDNLSSILAEQKGYQDFFISYRITRFIEAHWVEMAGKLALDLRVAYFKNGILLLESSNQMWVNEVAFYQQDVLNRINEVSKAYGKKFKIFRLKVIFSPKVRDDHPQSELGNGLPDLRKSSEKLRVMNELKLKDGMLICRSCFSVFTEGEICSFCRVERKFGA